MAGITALGTTFNLPNFVGELFAASREDTPFLSAIGGLTGGESTTSTLFQWQQYDLRDPSSRVRKEGDDAQTPVARVRANVTNVVEIHQETVAVSYTKLAAIGQFNSTGSNHAGSVGIAGSNPVTSELTWQVTQELKNVARDINFSFIRNSAMVNPSDNNSERKTCGILGAITTNEIDAEGQALDTEGEEFVLDLMQSIFDNGGIRESETRTLLTNSTQKRALSRFFIREYGQGYSEESRNVGGVNVTSIETDFGRLNIMLEPTMPQDEIAVVSLEECAPVFLEIPDKGFLFVEPLAKTGARDESQIYGEVGLKYGLEKHHGKIINLSTDGPNVES